MKLDALLDVDVLALETAAQLSTLVQLTAPAAPDSAAPVRRARWSWFSTAAQTRGRRPEST